MTIKTKYGKEKLMKLAKLIMSLILFFAISGSAAAQTQQTVRLTNGEWPPFLSEKLKHLGLISRIVTEAFASEGVKVEYGFFPWARSYNLAKKGRWDGSVAWSYTEDRAKYCLYSDPVLETTRVFFYLKAKPFDWKTMDDLKNLKIGATLEYNYGKDFRDAEKSGKIRVHRISEDEINFKKLLKGRIDIFPIDPDVGYAMIAKLFTKEEAELFTYHPKPVMAVPLHLILSKKVEKNKELIVLFNKGLKHLREKGTFDQYVAESRKGEYQ